MDNCILKIVLSILCLAFLTGCGGDTPSASIPNEYTVSDYHEKNLKDVKEDLKDKGLKNIKTIDLAGNETTDTRDMVIVEQSIPAGQRITSDDTITFTVARVCVILSEKIATLPLDQAIEVAYSMGFDDTDIKYYYSGYDNKDVSDTIERETQRDKWIATGADMQQWSNGIIIYCKHYDD